MGRNKRVILGAVFEFSEGYIGSTVQTEHLLVSRASIGCFWVACSRSHETRQKLCKQAPYVVDQDPRGSEWKVGERRTKTDAISVCITRVFRL